MALIRTDLALEATEDYLCTHDGETAPLPGIRTKQKQVGEITLTHVHILDDEAAQALGRARGHYITLEYPAVCASVDTADDVTHALAQALGDLLPKEGPVLVVGLGNDEMTPDALGPRAARRVLATRHIPEQLARQTGLEGLRSVCVLAPGVLGQTGMETLEITSAITQGLKPAAVLVIDALAARSVRRLGRTIQLADCGLSPGSGVRNARQPLNQETLGVPVISLGIPTVVDAATLISDFMEMEDSQQARGEIPARAHEMVVTPRDIDALIERASTQISLAVNAALQPKLSMEDLSYLVS